MEHNVGMAKREYLVYKLNKFCYLLVRTKY